MFYDYIIIPEYTLVKNPCWWSPMVSKYLLVQEIQTTLEIFVLHMTAPYEQAVHLHRNIFLNRSRRIVSPASYEEDAVGNTRD